MEVADRSNNGDICYCYRVNAELSAEQIDRLLSISKGYLSAVLHQVHKLPESARSSLLNANSATPENLIGASWLPAEIVAQLYKRALAKRPDFSLLSDLLQCYPASESVIDQIIEKKRFVDVREIVATFQLLNDRQIEALATDGDQGVRGSLTERELHGSYRLPDHVLRHLLTDSEPYVKQKAIEVVEARCMSAGVFERVHPLKAMGVN